MASADRKHLIVELPDGSYRDATADEIRRARELRIKRKRIERQLKALTAELDSLKCDHLVRYDEPGWMYDSRHCFACGESLGFL